MLDTAMIMTLLAVIALVYLLIHWCDGQVESEE